MDTMNTAFAVLILATGIFLCFAYVVNRCCRHFGWRVSANGMEIGFMLLLALLSLAAFYLS